MLEGGGIDATLAVLCQRAGELRRSPRARALHEPLRAVAGPAMAPRAQGGRGQGEGVRDGVQALAFHDVAHGVGTVEDAGFFGLLYAGI